MDALMRRVLFQWAPEEAHARALGALAVAEARPWLRGLLRGWYGAPAASPVEAMGLRFPNAVGLAAGWDKDGRAWRTCAALGFGHVEVGTVTPAPQPGNPTPRVFRDEGARVLVNRMGFPSEGASAVAARLSEERPYGMILGVNLGKNKDTALEAAADDYVAGVAVFEDVADYLVVNVSSPNTPGLRSLQTGAALRALLETVVRARKRRVPVVVKLSPDMDDPDLVDAVEAALAAGVDGIIATNTTLSREGVPPSIADEVGGASGAALTARAEAVLRRVREIAGPDVAVIAAGGVMSPDDAAARMAAGATLVQLYTGFVFGGVGLVRRVAERVG